MLKFNGNVRFDATIADRYPQVVGKNPTYVSRWRMQQNEQTLNAALAAVGRQDAVSAGQGLHLARDLEQAYNEVLRTEYADMSAFELFPVDTSMSPGAKLHTIRRVKPYGSAGWHRGNAAPNTVDVDQEEEVFYVNPISVGIEWDIFEQQHADFAGFDLQGELRRAASEAIYQFANEKAWMGDEQARCLGVLNYPYLPKAAGAIAFNDSSTPEQILRELNRLANLNRIESLGKKSPTRMLMSIGLKAYLGTRLMSPENSTTILDMFLQSSGNTIVDCVDVPELTDIANEQGIEYILLYRAGDRNSIHLAVPQDITMLPVQREDNFALRIPMYMKFGGCRMFEPLNNLLVTVSR